MGRIGVFPSVLYCLGGMLPLCSMCFICHYLPLLAVTPRTKKIAELGDVGAIEHIVGKPLVRRRAGR